MGKTIANVASKKLPGPKSNGTVALAAGAGAAGATGKGFHDVIKARTESTISDQKVEKGKDDLRKARNPHNKKPKAGVNQ